MQGINFRKLNKIAVLSQTLKLHVLFIITFTVQHLHKKLI